MILLDTLGSFLLLLSLGNVNISGFECRRPTIRLSSTTILFEQKKPPRFTQQAHKPQKKEESSISTSSSSKPAGNKRKPKQQQVWESGKSIDELENTMTTRWGTLEDSKQKDETDGLGRAVFDPWDDDKGKSKKAPTFVREFYDEDDEGFEVIEEDDDDNNNDYDTQQSSSSKMKISHLIAPKPAGGRGTNQMDDAPSGGSYFFNPKSAASSNDNNTNNNNSQQASSKTEESSDTKKPKREQPPAAKALLDEDGDPILFTVDEALYRFQSTLGEDTMEIIETAEVPIVAIKAQSWDDLGITSEALLANLNYMNCPTPLAVQEKACPPILTGNDVLVGTYTGSGKTLAFLAPLIERFLWQADEDPGLAVLIIAPGRELASQIVSVARDLLQDTPLTVQLAIGGTTFSRNLEQIRKRKPNILVGTPGRIAELVVGKPGDKSGRLKIGSLQALVMDEFDALLEYKPHREPTRAIMQHLKRRHGDALQSILCSATASDIMDSAKVVDFLRPGFSTAMADDDDIFVTNSNNKANSKGAPQVSRTVLHGVVHVPHKRFALDTVRRVLHTDPIPQQILIFCENSRKVDIVVDRLGNMGIVAAALHGGQGSEKMDRAEVAKALREGYVGIVVATELAARGLDAPLLTHVINLDLPTDASHYAHRAGRCGRGGRPGVVINVTTSPKERNVPKRFADALGIDLYSVEPRAGKLIMVDPETQKLDT